MNQVISLKNIGKRYGSNIIFSNISFAIKDNDFVLIKGKSGCGKTTLLNILSFQDTKYEGEYRLLEKNVKNLTHNEINKYRNSLFGFVFQDYRLIKNRTVLDNILMPYLYSTLSVDKEWFISIAKRLDIDSILNRDVNFLSGGEQQRVAIARALMMKPRILFLDEPFSNLDNKNKDILIKQLKEISLLPKTSLILVSHDIPDKLLENTTFILDMEDYNVQIKRSLYKY